MCTDEIAMNSLKDVLKNFLLKPAAKLPTAKKIDYLYDPVKVGRLETLLDNKNFSVETKKTESKEEAKESVQANKRFGESVDNKKKIDII
jgi:hypothetical protein